MSCPDIVANSADGCVQSPGWRLTNVVFSSSRPPTPLVAGTKAARKEVCHLYAHGGVVSCSLLIAVFGLFFQIAAIKVCHWNGLQSH